MKINIDEYELSEIIMEEMFKFFNEVGVSWLYHLKDRKKDPDGFGYNKFRLPANRIVNSIKDN